MSIIGIIGAFINGMLVADLSMKAGYNISTLQFWVTIFIVIIGNVLLGIR